MPGYLVPADLGRLAGVANLWEWAEQHLRASPGFVMMDRDTKQRYRLGTLVPARNEKGQCHWFVNGRCSVHADAPYGCAFFDEHQSEKEGDIRSTYGAMEIKKDLMDNGLYTQVWKHLAMPENPNLIKPVKPPIKKIK